MFSVTNTGMNFFPLCTAKVSPIKSGVMVERRDQVLMTFFDPADSASTFLTRWSSTNGPFLIDLAILSSLYARMLFCTSLNYEASCSLVSSGLVTLCRDAPRGNRMTPAGSPAFATAMGVVDGVHGDATH